MAAAVVRLVYPDDAPALDGNQGAALVDELIAKYSEGLPTFKRAGHSARGDVVILLTGTTGNLGSNVLATLLTDKRVKKVYALNRTSTRRDKQKLAFIESGFPLETLASGGIHLLEGDISRADLGLDHATFAEVRVK